MREGKSPPSAEKPLREGGEAYYEVFMCHINGIRISLFNDIGCLPCYVDETLVKLANLTPYKSRKKIKIGGLGGKGGPIVNQNVLVPLHLYGKTGDPVWINMEIVPDNTFPAPITLGKTFHELQLGRWTEQSFVFKKILLQPLFKWPIKNGIPQKVFTATEHLQQPPQSALPKLPPELPEFKNEAGLRFVKRLWKKYPGVFVPSLRQATLKTKVLHNIDVGDHPHIKLPAKQCSPAHMDFIRRWISRQLGTIFATSDSDWASPLVFVPKKDKQGKIHWVLTKLKEFTGRQARNLIPDKALRVCVNYRSLNKATKKHAHPLPNASYQIQFAAGHVWYCFFDLKDGFWQVGLTVLATRLAAFCTPKGLYEWLCIPFGLTNAPATFQRFMEEVLLPYVRAGLLDDICVWGNTREEAEKRATAVIARLAKYGLVLNLAKCEWMVTEGRFLGFIISKEDIRADPKKVEAITSRPLPTTTTKLRGFLNAAGFLRSLIHGFSGHAAPLYPLTSGGKGTAIKLNKEQVAAFHKLKEALTTAPVVRAFCWSLPVYLWVDSSAKWIGGTMMQPHPSTKNAKTVLHPVEYYSHALTSTQQRYSSQERELLAVVFGLRHWRMYTEGSDVTVFSDHQSLRDIRTKTEQPARILRFLDVVEHFGVTIKYVPGDTNHLADYLSRPAEAYTTTETISQSVLDDLVITNEEIQAFAAIGFTDKTEFAGRDSAFPSAEDPMSLGRLMNPIEVETWSPNRQKEATQIQRPEVTEEGEGADQIDRQITKMSDLNDTDLIAITEYLLHKSTLPRLMTKKMVDDNFTLHDGALHRMIKHTTAELSDPLIPTGKISLLRVLPYHEMVTAVIRLHENRAHAKVGALQRAVESQYWHPDLVLALHEAIRTCPQCQIYANKLGSAIQPHLTPIPMPAPLTCWGADHTGDLYGIHEGKVASLRLLNAVEYATGTLRSEFVTGDSHMQTRPFFTRLHFEFGAPKMIIADNAGAFMSEEAVAWHAARGTKMQRTSSHHPRSNGLMERVNGMIKAIFYGLQQQDRTEEMTVLIVKAVAIYNRRSKMHGYSPFFLLYGTQPPDHAARSRRRHGSPGSGTHRGRRSRLGTGACCSVSA